MAYRRYVLTIVTAVYTLNFVDRGLIALVLQPIKEDMHLSDTQLGFLTGIAFALFYSTLGLPIARWADRGDRATITAIAIALWGLTVMSCLWVTSFAWLVCARIAAGVGEAGCMPPTYSLLGDYFPASVQRARAMTIYMLGGPVSALISFVLGGWLNERYGWRMTFFLLGAPALIVAAMVKMSITDPRVLLERRLDSERRVPRLTDVVALMWKRRSLRHLSAAVVLLFTVSSGLAPWYGAVMIRGHGMGTAELGVWFGLIFAGSGILGILCGGSIAAWLFAEDESAQLRLSAVTAAGLVPCLALFLFLSNKYEALAALIPFSLLFNFYLGPTFALLQRLVADDMRATTLALVMLSANLVGMGLGSQIVGIVSDLLLPIAKGESLRYAMLLASLAALGAAQQFCYAARTIKQDLLSSAGSNALAPRVGLTMSLHGEGESS